LPASSNYRSQIPAARSERALPSQCYTVRHCTLEAMRTQAAAFHGLLIFNFRMRERRVLGWRPRRLAAPCGPSIRQLQTPSTRVI